MKRYKILEIGYTSEAFTIKQDCDKGIVVNKDVQGHTEKCSERKRINS